MEVFQSKWCLNDVPPATWTVFILQMLLSQFVLKPWITALGDRLLHSNDDLKNSSARVFLVKLINKSLRPLGSYVKGHVCPQVAWKHNSEHEFTMCQEHPWFLKTLLLLFYTLKTSIYQMMPCIRILSQYFLSVNFGQKSPNLHPRSPHVYSTNEVLRVSLNRMPYFALMNLSGRDNRMISLIAEVLVQ